MFHLARRLRFAAGLFAIALSGCGEDNRAPSAADPEIDRLEATKKRLDKQAAEAHERAEAWLRAAEAEDAAAALYRQWAQAHDAVANGKTALERAALAATADALDARHRAAVQRSMALTTAANMKAVSDAAR
jgi:hypothetical protein